ncbi:NYN domain-containing protein [Pseudomonadota bacterium]
MTKVSIFVDVQNIYYTTRQAYGCSFDYNAFWAAATHNREVVKAIAYATESRNEKQRQFQNILRAIGFEVKLKPYIQRADGSAKGDWDVGITIDVIELAENTDIAVLASGDGDFDLLLRHISRKYSTKSEVYGVPQLTANSLIQAAYRYVPIEKTLLLNKNSK